MVVYTHVYAHVHVDVCIPIEAECMHVYVHVYGDTVSGRVGVTVLPALYLEGRYKAI